MGIECSTAPTSVSACVDADALFDGLDLPVPYARALEAAWLPQSADIVRAASGVVDARAVR